MFVRESVVGHGSGVKKAGQRYLSHSLFDGRVSLYVCVFAMDRLHSRG
jgi:hypothetical protein